MFGTDHKSMKQTLAYLVNEKHNTCQGNQVLAAEQMVQVLSGDARFAPYDAVKLVARVQHCGQSGAQLDLDDTNLLKGGSPRPLSDSRWR